MFDLVILGGGAAAFAAACRAEQLGKRSLLINDGRLLPLGGTCVNVGCIPSKILLHQAARARETERSGPQAFLEALKKARTLVEGFRREKYEKVLEGFSRVEFVEGRGRLLEPHTVAAGGKTYRARHILIATGAFPARPPVPGLPETPHFTYRDILEASQPFASGVVLGGGPVAVEFSQVFHRFGLKTYVLQRSPRILRRFEPRCAERLQEVLSGEGLSLYTGARLLGGPETECG